MTNTPRVPSGTPDGSTNISEERQHYTEELGDGTPVENPAG